jgi:hypothetical protein
MTPQDADVPFGARLMSDVANPERILQGGDCNKTILLNAHWGDVPRQVGKCGAMFVMVGCDVCYGREVSHTYDS